MDKSDVADLKRTGLTVLRLGPLEWIALSETRRGGRRFSLNFAHHDARQARASGLVLVVVPGSALQLGMASSVSATSTFDSRVVFHLLTEIAPSTIEELLSAVANGNLRIPRDKLLTSSLSIERVSEKLGFALIDLLASEPRNGAAFARIIAHRSRPRRFDDARALQDDALRLAIKAFGGSGEAESIGLTGAATAIAAVHLLEDAVIEHDARWLPGWSLSRSDLTGKATFERNGERLDVYTANKRPLEEIFGVDLIYLNRARESLVMVQYKMLEPETRGRQSVEFGPFSYDKLDEQKWLVRIDDQFRDELDRMRSFDRDLDPGSTYRLHPGAFFFKLVRRKAATNTAGILLALGHLEHFLAGGDLKGKRGGLRLSYESLKGHYLRSEPFVELVRSGYVGTRGATTRHMETLINAALSNGRAVVAAVQRSRAK